MWNNDTSLIAINDHELSTENHNYCRNFGPGEPFCMIFYDEVRSTIAPCSIPTCCIPKNDFLHAQSFCDNQAITKEDVPASGREVLTGEFPYIANIRYNKPLKDSSGEISDHVCVGTLISSCWVLTVAHCIPESAWFTDRGGAEHWFRVDVGRYR